MSAVRLLLSALCRPLCRPLCCPHRYRPTHRAALPALSSHCPARSCLHGGGGGVAYAMTESRFSCDYAKRATSSCKKCKTKLEKGGLRLAKLVPNRFSEGAGDMKQYHHAACLFETFVRARAATKIIAETEDLDGYADLESDDKDRIKQLISDTMAKKGSPSKKTPKAQAAKKSPATPQPKVEVSKPAVVASPTKIPSPDLAGAASSHVDNSFRKYRQLCAEISVESSYNSKTNIVSRYLKKGSAGDGFHGDVHLLLKLLLPGVIKVVYNLHSKQIVKIFSQVFGASHKDMVESLEQGDVSETVKIFFEESKVCHPQSKSTLSLQEVDALLDELSQQTKEDDQQRVVAKMAARSTSNDLKMIIRLIKHDLRISAGAKHILGGLDVNAYAAFQASRDLRDVVDRVGCLRGANGIKSSLTVRANLMTPILPMLAEACKSVDQAFHRCKNGMYAEIKYDGERVQVHKSGDDFQYFSRSLKPVLNHKVAHFQQFIPKAFPGGSQLILDSEVLLIDTATSKPLPFGTLGVHKKQAFNDANVCLFVFDCLHYNGESLMNKPIKERRRFLHENMVEIPNRILFSEMQHITEPDDLGDLMLKVFREGLEGLVLKDVNGIYEPGKRHWLKVKKDYLAHGVMADSADLVVLGAYFGSGSKGGIMSVFLMGVYNPASRQWCTVTKCSGGYDDATLAKLQDELDMVKISKDYSKVPTWLNINRNLVPDFVVPDPKSSPVWEITGAEFTQSEAHTADGISIRFPRCTRFRDDKSWKEATDLPLLKELYKKSKEYSTIPDLLTKGGGRKGGPFRKATPPAAVATPPAAVATPPAAVTMTTPPSSKSPAKSTKRRAVDSLDESPQKKSKPEDVLPNVFCGMTFHLAETLPKYEQLKRYIIAYDGEVVKTHEKEHASFVVTEMEGEDGREVCVDWVWCCVKKKALVPRRK